MKKVLLFSFCMIIAGSVSSQLLAYKINVQLQNYGYDTVFLGYYLGGKTYAKDTGLVKNGIASFSGEDKLDKGMYLLLEQETSRFVNFLVDDNQQSISFVLDFDKPTDMKVTGSAASAALVGYLKLLSSKRAENEALSRQLQEAANDDKKKTAIQRQLEELDSWVRNYQKEYIRKNPASLLSLIIKFSLPYEPPVFEGSEEQNKMNEYLWYKEHWFDNTSLNDPRTLRTDFILQKIDYYIDKLTVQHPDSIILSVDEVLARVKPAPETYKFLLITLLNKYATSSLVGMDAVYVHIALKYYATGQATWAKEKELYKILDNAYRLEPILIGKKAPDFELPAFDGNKIRLWDFDAAYTILFFWNENCSTCQKALASLIEVEKQYRNRGIKVLTVCTGSGNAEDYRQFIRKNNMSSFFNTKIESPESNIKSMYNITVTPQVFVLDKGKVIQSKNISTSQLKEVLEYQLNQTR